MKRSSQSLLSYAFKPGIVVPTVRRSHRIRITSQLLVHSIAIFIQLSPRMRYQEYSPRAVDPDVPRPLVAKRRYEEALLKPPTVGDSNPEEKADLWDIQYGVYKARSTRQY
ncbi:hypothetical protein Hypma_002402 [Hypsizygus marmoreus]|uniref:Uncharacterized protein n=1 Tax=Hypsizygus marmoreus TaxID=39966 RepID=A0A369JBW7_HYPMA|nr:hypothetical protein Hypma_002402 [Hypsizygus marmoreus]